MAGQFRARMPLVGTALELVEVVAVVAVEDVIVLVVGLVDKIVVKEPVDEDVSGILLFFRAWIPPTVPPTTAATTKITAIRTSNICVRPNPHQRFC